MRDEVPWGRATVRSVEELHQFLATLRHIGARVDQVHISGRADRRFAIVDFWLPGDDRG
jgi:hypothetical protein